jgi:hypothetical protein
LYETMSQDLNYNVMFSPRAMMRWLGAMRVPVLIWVWISSRNAK